MAKSKKPGSKGVSPVRKRTLRARAKARTGELFIEAGGQLRMIDKSAEQVVLEAGRVECLGLTFDSEDARREHFLPLLHEKLKDPEFRKTPGFPIATDEHILRLSDPPYFTACPNPFLEEFIRHHARPFDPAEVYRREPFAVDVSVGKTDPLYKAIPEPIWVWMQKSSSLRPMMKDQTPEAANTRLRVEVEDRWYIPDPNRATDLEKIRERALLKDFDTYRQAPQRTLRSFRIEAVRAGFRAAWATRDYAIILAVADKLPEEVLQEDPQLLMWYDQALARSGAEA